VAYANDVIHVEGTCKFLTGYWDSLSQMPQGSQPDVDGKGKVVLGQEGSRRKPNLPDDGRGTRVQQIWRRPPQDWVKVNTDAAFCEASGKASAGIVVRDSQGRVILTTWRVLRGCASLDQAEVEVVLEGLRLTVEWVRWPAWLESDYLNIINDLQSTRPPPAHT
jgi:hypothetical protein